MSFDVGGELFRLTVLDRGMLQKLMEKLVSDLKKLPSETHLACLVNPVQQSDKKRSVHADTTMTVDFSDDFDSSSSCFSQKDPFACSELDKYLNEALCWNLSSLVPGQALAGRPMMTDNRLNESDANEPKQLSLSEPDQQISGTKNISLSADANYLYVSHENRSIRIRGSYRPTADSFWPLPDFPSVQTVPRTEIALSSAVCGTEFCSLGCVCDSINKGSINKEHCRKAKCMFGCVCFRTVKKLFKSRSRRKPYSRPPTKIQKKDKTPVVRLTRLSLPETVSVFCLEHQLLSCHCLSPQSVPVDGTKNQPLPVSFKSWDKVLSHDENYCLEIDDHEGQTDIDSVVGIENRASQAENIGELPICLDTEMSTIELRNATSEHVTGDDLVALSEDGAPETEELVGTRISLDMETGIVELRNITEEHETDVDINIQSENCALETERIGGIRISLDSKLSTVELPNATVENETDDDLIVLSDDDPPEAENRGGTQICLDIDTGIVELGNATDEGRSDVDFVVQSKTYTPDARNLEGLRIGCDTETNSSELTGEHKTDDDVVFLSEILAPEAENLCGTRISLDVETGLVELGNGTDELGKKSSLNVDCRSAVSEPSFVSANRRMSFESTAKGKNEKRNIGKLTKCLRQAERLLVESFSENRNPLRIDTNIPFPGNPFGNPELGCPFENVDDFGFERSFLQKPERILEIFKSGATVSNLKDFYQSTEVFTLVKTDVLREWFVKGDIDLRVHVCTSGETSLYIAETETECFVNHGINKTIAYPGKECDLDFLPFSFVHCFQDLFSSSEIIAYSPNLDQAVFVFAPFLLNGENDNFLFLRIAIGIVECNVEQVVQKHSAQTQSGNFEVKQHNKKVFVPKQQSKMDDCSKRLSFPSFLFGPLRSVDQLPDTSPRGKSQFDFKFEKEFNLFRDNLLCKFNQSKFGQPQVRNFEWLVIDIKCNGDENLFNGHLKIKDFTSEETKAELLEIQFLNRNIVCFLLQLKEIRDYLFIGPIGWELAVIMTEHFPYCFQMSSFSLTGKSQSSAFFHSYANNSGTSRRKLVKEEFDFKLIGKLTNPAGIACQLFFDRSEDKVYIYGGKRNLLIISPSLSCALTWYIEEFVNWKICAVVRDSKLQWHVVFQSQSGFRLLSRGLIGHWFADLAACISSLVYDGLVVSHNLTFDIAGCVREDSNIFCSFYYCSARLKWFGIYCDNSLFAEPVVTTIRGAINLFVDEFRFFSEPCLPMSWEPSNFIEARCSRHATCFRPSIRQLLLAHKKLNDQLKYRRKKRVVQHHKSNQNGTKCVQSPVELDIEILT